MITVEEVQKHLSRGTVTSVRPCKLKSYPSITGVYVSIKGVDYDLFIQQSQKVFSLTHRGTKLLKYSHPFGINCLYIRPHQAIFTSAKGLKV